MAFLIGVTIMKELRSYAYVRVRISKNTTIVYTSQPNSPMSDPGMKEDLETRTRLRFLVWTCPIPVGLS